MNKLLKASIPAAIALGLVACGGGSSNDDNTVSMRLAATNLAPLGDGFDYEGWIIVNGEAVSTGRFDIDENGETVPASFDLDLTQANAADTFVLTIEPPVETDDPGPADTHILAGAIVDGVSNIVTDHPGAFSSDFTESAGTFFLATPSNGNTTPTQGIWFFNPPPVGPSPSLTLPELPAGWVYEGWVVGEDGPITTGTFTSGAEADSDGAGPTGGPLATPPFPGQDFITPPLDLVGLTAVITVEPSPDNSVDPFSMRPLRSEIVATGNVLENISAGNLPSGTVTIDF